MKRKACFTDWWKLYDSSMIWSIISKFLLNLSLQRISDGSLGNSQPQSLTMSQPPPSLWKRDQGYENGCVLLVQPVLNTQHKKDVGSVMFSRVFAKQEWSSTLGKWNRCKAAVEFGLPAVWFPCKETDSCFPHISHMREDRHARDRAGELL